MMFVLHVNIQMKASQAKDAERVFAGPFKTAISAQPGFQDVRFLRPRENGDYVLAIAFADQAAQQKWVATDLHADVWSQMEAHFAGYSLQLFDTV
jgi:heme-degrading monooxygenase HmoA